MEANRPAAHLDAYMRQLAVEALIPLGAHDLALSELGKAVDSPSFVDADWIERCQALDPIRDREEVARMISEVSRRADAIWRVRT
ncbi:MAG: hypothetical protein VYE73_05505 [Acidobacteriota bacterium]|nr:hypothetical protein [Acidobacteriota bacterium]